jgi:hypothetical protein
MNVLVVELSFDTFVSSNNNNIRIGMQTYAYVIMM